MGAVIAAPSRLVNRAPSGAGSGGRARSSRRPRRCPARRCRNGGRGPGSCPVWPKCSTPSERVRWPVTRAEPGERRRMAVEHRDEAAMGRHVAEQPLDMAAGVDEAALAGPLRRRPAGVEPVGGGDGEQPDIAPVLGHQADRLDRLRRDRARIGDDDLGVRAGPAHPIGAVDDVARQGPASSPAAAARGCGSRGADRPSRRSRRAARSARLGSPLAALLQVVEGPAQDHRQLVDEGRLEGGEAVLRQADQRRARSTGARRPPAPASRRTASRPG